MIALYMLTMCSYMLSICSHTAHTMKRVYRKRSELMGKVNESVMLEIKYL